MYKEVTKELTIEELAERWEWLKWKCKSDLRITEQFPKRGEISYIVSGLTMEQEDVYVICSDYDEKIVKYYSVLMMFLRESLVSIKLLPIRDGVFYQERLEFSDGLILIEIA